MSYQRGYADYSRDPEPTPRADWAMDEPELLTKQDLLTYARRAFWRGVLISVIATALILATVSISRAHSWYSQACCSGKDCAAIPASSITETKGGWIITLQPGDHPMVTSHPVNEFIPFSKGRTSQDGDYHACVRAETPSQVTPPERIICLYVPNPGGTS